METMKRAVEVRSGLIERDAIGQNDYVGIRIPKSILKSQGVYFNSFLDGIGPAYCIDIDLLNTIIKGLWFF